MTNPHGWQPIETAPKDGTPIRVKIPGFGDHLEVAWQPGFAGDDGHDYCCWVVIQDVDYPPCWSDGVCWESNMDEEQSAQPTHWMPIPPPQSNATSG